MVRTKVREGGCVTPPAGPAACFRGWSPTLLRLTQRLLAKQLPSERQAQLLADSRHRELARGLVPVVPVTRTFRDIRQGARHSLQAR
ncbi:hypothetical protein ACOMHN_062765 [Nucella lapillus]